MKLAIRVDGVVTERTKLLICHFERRCKGSQLVDAKRRGHYHLPQAFKQVCFCLASTVDSAVDTIELLGAPQRSLLFR